MRGRIWKTVLVFALLTGCALEPSREDQREVWRGRWVGFFESSLGLLGCPSRGPLELEVKDRTIAGEAQGNGFVMSLSGTLDGNGAVRNGIFFRDRSAAAIVTGTFLENNAAGRWQGASCEGIWSLRRISR